MAKAFDYDVIGSGLGGEGAAMKCAKSGKNVAMVEENPLVGGNCTHRATIPNKSLRHRIQMMADLDDYGDVDFQQVLRSAEPVID